MENTLSIKLPNDVLQKLYRIADFTKRTIDDVIVNTINATFVAPTNLPGQLSDELACMQQMKDESLWAAISPSVTGQQRQRLQTLNDIASQRALTQTEINEQQALLFDHHRSILRRAQAIAVLTLRGHVVSDSFLMQTVV